MARDTPEELGSRSEAGTHSVVGSLARAAGSLATGAAGTPGEHGSLGIAGLASRLEVVVPEMRVADTAGQVERVPCNRAVEDSE